MFNIEVISSPSVSIFGIFPSPWYLPFFLSPFFFSFAKKNPTFSSPNYFLFFVLPSKKSIFLLRLFSSFSYWSEWFTDGVGDSVMSWGLYDMYCLVFDKLEHLWHRAWLFSNHSFITWVAKEDLSGFMVRPPSSSFQIGFYGLTWEN